MNPNPNQTAAYHALEQAQQARKAGDKRLARQYAEQAARLAPEIEDVWLMMAALASPRASVVFMEKALQINPQSERVRQGMRWAVERLRKEAPRPSVASRPAHVKKPATQPRFSYAVILLSVACLLVAVWAVLYVTPAAASLINSSIFSSEQKAPSWAPVDIAKPTYTLVPSPTTTPTLTPPPTITPTTTASPTETMTDIPTPLPSDTPTITPTDEASSTPFATDVVPGAEGEYINDPSPTPLPTDTAFPVAPTQSISVPVPPNNPASTGGAHWVDVNLTNQMVYAYEGNTIVNSFVVSTGTWLTPTVTGKYHIYVKLRYANMNGPGYYLPNVPYTMFFYKGYALHGTYWHSNFGTPMSHGCVNLSIPDSEWLYNFSSVGTLVNVHY
jgi:lipoprotein-anchoring transpeptidase ErfK/SrfK